MEALALTVAFLALAVGATVLLYLCWLVVYGALVGAHKTMTWARGRLLQR